MTFLSPVHEDRKVCHMTETKYFILTEYLFSFWITHCTFHKITSNFNYNITGWDSGEFWPVSWILFFFMCYTVLQSEGIPFFKQFYVSWEKSSAQRLQNIVRSTTTIRWNKCVGLPAFLPIIQPSHPCLNSCKIMGLHRPTCTLCGNTHIIVKLFCDCLLLTPHQVPVNH